MGSNLSKSRVIKFSFNLYGVRFFLLEVNLTVDGLINLETIKNKNSFIEGLKKYLNIFLKKKEKKT